MQLYDAIEEMAAKAGKSVYRIQKEIGKYNVITMSKSRGTVLGSVILAKAANACGYKLALVPEDSMPEDAIEIIADQR